MKLITLLYVLCSTDLGFSRKREKRTLPDISDYTRLRNLMNHHHPLMRISPTRPTEHILAPWSRFNPRITSQSKWHYDSGISNDWSDSSFSESSSSPKTPYRQPWVALRTSWRLPSRISLDLPGRQTSMELLGSFNSSRSDSRGPPVSEKSLSSLESFSRELEPNIWPTPTPTWRVTITPPPKLTGRQRSKFIPGYFNSFDSRPWLQEKIFKEPALVPTPRKNSRPVFRIPLLTLPTLLTPWKPKRTAKPKSAPASEYSDLSSSNDLSSSSEFSSSRKTSYWKPKKHSWPVSRRMWTQPVRILQPSMSFVSGFRALSSSSEPSSSLETSSQKPKPNSWITPEPTWRVTLGTSHEQGGRQRPGPIPGSRSIDLPSTSNVSELQEKVKETEEPFLKPTPQSNSRSTLRTTQKTARPTPYPNWHPKTTKKTPETTSISEPDPALDEDDLSGSSSKDLSSSSESSSLLDTSSQNPKLNPSSTNSRLTLRTSPQRSTWPKTKQTATPTPETTSLSESEPPLDYSNLSGSSSKDLFSSSKSPGLVDTPNNEANLSTTEQTSDSPELPGRLLTTRPDHYLISYKRGQNGEIEWHKVKVPEGKRLLFGDTKDTSYEAFKKASSPAKDPPIRANFRFRD